MLDGLRDLFLAALRCDNEETAKRLVSEWNDQINAIQKVFDHMETKREVEHD